MHRILLLLTLAPAMLLAAGWSLPVDAGSQVYKCKDEDGRVIYRSQRCDEGQESEQLAIRYSATDPEEIEARAQARKELLDSYAEQREKRAAARAEAEAERQQKRQACEAARAELRRASEAKRMSRGEGDNKTYLSNEEINALKAERQAKVREACGR